MLKTLSWPLLLLLLGAMLRLLWLGEIPGGLNQDEASIGYDAWALLHYGIDRNGVSWPVNFIAWGSGQNVLYAYLSMPFIALFDLSVFSVRLTSAFWGVISLWIFWRLGKRSSDTMGLWALLILVTSPWHIMASRWALECNVLPAVVLVAVLLLVRAPEHLNRRLPLAVAVLTLSIYAYGPAYFFAPIFLLCAVIIIYRQTPVTIKTLAISALCALLVAIPMMIFLVNNSVGSGHIHLGPLTIPHYPSDARYSNIFLPFAQGGMARIPENANQVLHMLFAGKDDGLPWNAIPFWGPQFVFLTPFVFLGAVVSTCSKASLTDKLMLAWLLCALLTAFFTEANINRINLVWLPSLWLAARGLDLLSWHKLLARCIQVAILICGLWFSLQYFTSWSARISADFFEGFGEAITRVVELAPKDAPITITANSNMPYISTLFFSKTSPQTYVKTAVIPNRRDAFQSVESFDRFKIGLKPGQFFLESFWVAHKSELGMFIDPSYRIESFSDYSAITRSPPELAGCLRPLTNTSMTGSQDYGQLTQNGEVDNEGKGFRIANQYIPFGFGVHGDSEWTLNLNEPIYQLSVGVGISDNNGCSDGMKFKVQADGKTLYTSGQIMPDTLGFTNIPLNNPKQLKFITEAGKDNKCDHGNWVRPIITTCNPK